MGKFKFELNRAGVRELLLSDEMMGICEDHAKRIQAKAGEGYSVYRGRNRVNVSVETKEAMADNYKSNVLLKAVSRG